MDYKLLLSLLATLITILSFWQYIRDIFSHKTLPHTFTWLIWLITQGIASIGLWYGGGGIGALDLTVGTFFIGSVLLLSLWRGTKDVTRSDGVLLVIALLAIGVWVLLDNPFLSVLLVSIIDVIGYFPTIRKSYNDPWSESLVSWVGFIISNYLAFLALQSYNSLTVTYLIAINGINILLVLECLVRRVVVPRPELKSE